MNGKTLKLFSRRTNIGEGSVDGIKILLYARCLQSFEDIVCTL
jgi:hypothetical protein